MLTLAAAYNLKTGISRDTPDPELLVALCRIQRQLGSGKASDDDVAIKQNPS